MSFRNHILTILILVLIISNSFGSDSTKTLQNERPWALGMIARTATIPFATEGDRTVGTLVPLIYYDGKIFYMRALEGGFHFYRNDNWLFSILGRLHFVDIPKDYQNEVQGDNVRLGLQAKYSPLDWQYLDLEIMNDYWGAWSSNIRLGADFSTGAFQLDPFLNSKLKARNIIADTLA